NQSLTKSEIDEISAVDIGELLQKISGVNLKSYGSLGGLKTVSMRGLGSNHTSIVKDGFTLSNAQTGQVNLGQIETDNVVGLVSAIGERFKTILPISAQISGNSFLIKTFENTLSSDTLQVRASYKNGSFNQNHAYFGVKYRPKNISIALHGSGKVSTGGYGYSSENEFDNTTRKRLNNDYQDYSVGANLAYRFKQGVSRIGFSHKSIEQGLPGAVILYNTNPDERLSTRLNQLNYDLQTTINKTVFRFYSSASKSFLEYVDLTYLNAIGGIE
ncbi:MAG: TonB-dependent receptor, partial [Flavobacteriales bacterium]